MNLCLLFCHQQTKRKENVTGEGGKAKTKNGFEEIEFCRSESATLPASVHREPASDAAATPRDELRETHAPNSVGDAVPSRHAGACAQRSSGNEECDLCVPKDLNSQVPIRQSLEALDRFAVPKMMNMTPYIAVV